MFNLRKLQECTQRANTKHLVKVVKPENVTVRIHQKVLVAETYMELGLPDIEYNQYLQLRYFRNSTLNPAEIYILGLSSLNFKVLKPAQSHYSGLYFR